jgi:hypothetical protein
MITFMVIAMVAPYLYVETISRMLHQQVKTAVEDAYEESKIGGPMLYYKVHFYWGDNARAYVIGHEKQSWGGYDRPIIDVKLVKGAKGWKAASYEFIQSDQRNEDHVTYPPYW